MGKHNMKHIYAFESNEDYKKYQKVIERFSTKLEKYQKLLQENFKLIDLPKGIVWTTERLATTVFSNIPIPAFTNKDIIYITPDLTAWRELFLEQLDGLKHDEVEVFYKNISEDHVFSIVAHELTHHSDLFMDEFDDDRDDSIWFEEGMCEYMGKKFTLDEEEFTAVTEVEAALVEMFKEKYGTHTLDAFGASSYEGNLTSIMFDYWRSFLAIKYLVEERANGDIMQVFNAYHAWDKAGRKVPLTKYFQVEDLFK